MTATLTPTATVPASSKPVLIAEVSGANAVDLSWTAVHDAVRYELFYQVVGVTDWQQLDDGDLRGTSYPHTYARRDLTVVQLTRASAWASGTSRK